MINIKQLDNSEIENQDFDFFIVSSGFESRAILQAQKYSINARNKIALGFRNERDDLVRKNNDSYFKSNGYSMQIIDEDQVASSILDSIVEDVMEHARKSSLVSVYIDYSSMTRNLYSYLLLKFYISENRTRIKLCLGYSHAEFISYNGHEALNRIVSPLFGYCDLSMPFKPTALIVGMGNEPNRIYGLKEYFDAVPYLFHSDKSYNEQYGEEIAELNAEIISGLNSDRIFKFPIHDLVYTNYVLENLCLSLIKKFRVVIAPCGPKPFSLLAMINSLNHQNSIEVWRISPGEKISKIDRKPTGLVSVIEVNFELN